MNKKLRAALYPRVSHHDQAEFGFSLEAQKKHLIQLCELKGYEIVDIYEDAGISAKDTNRPEFQRMMNDVKKGNVDVIVCYKLDRLTRSLSDLEWVLKELDKYNCNLVSASEDINTSTANGRFFIKIVILLAELELERTSERIKFVFEDKIKNGGAITGSQPLGYTVGLNEDGEKIVVKDKETEAEITEIFDYFEKTQSLSQTAFYTNEKYGRIRESNAIKHFIKHPMYYGHYKGNDEYCTPYMTKERWDKLNKILTDRNVKVYSSRVYIFSSLLRCQKCGKKITGVTSKRGDKEYMYYHCAWKYKNKTCDSIKKVREEDIEEYLIHNLNNYIDDYFNKLEKNYKDTEIKYRNSTEDIAKLRAEQERTTISFNKGRISEDRYDKEWERLEREIAKLKEMPVKKDISHLKDLQGMSWVDMYRELAKENKQIFWRKFIDVIEIDLDNYIKGGEFINVHFL